MDGILSNSNGSVEGRAKKLSPSSELPAIEHVADGLTGARLAGALDHSDSTDTEERRVLPPTDPMVTSLLTDMYQLTMAYAYWKAKKHNDHAVFDLLFRKNPFGGEYTLFAGLEECVRFVANFRYSQADVAYLRTIMPPSCEDAFFDYLLTLDCSTIRIMALPEGYVAFPRVPLMRVEGPLLVAQLLETTLLVLVNYASLVATNAARHRQVAGPNKMLFEFGLRRAQGPDGAVSASRYCFMGGFDATSNVEAGLIFNIPVKGTHSHAFVSSFLALDEIKERALPSADASHVCADFVALVLSFLHRMQESEKLRDLFAETNESELAAFTSYALAFPTHFQALVDTYDVLRSGVPNYCAVALALHQLGYRAVGIRLDSGDLAYLSQQARLFLRHCEAFFHADGLSSAVITASSDINEATLEALNKQGHEIDAFGIGTHLVTCAKQPALGCVYKLVEINSQPRIKLSQDFDKVTIPGKKACYRLYGREGYPLVDLLMMPSDPRPQVGERILCRHPFSQSKRAYVVPHRVEPLYRCFWRGKQFSLPDGQVEEESEGVERLPVLVEVRERCRQQITGLRPDHIQGLNPTPYKISVTDRLYNFIQDLWMTEAPLLFGAAAITVECDGGV
ncbi:unnamed protein product [Closterium sp. NIES-53]